MKRATSFRRVLATATHRWPCTAARGGASVFMTEIDATFSQVINRQFDRDPIACENADVMLTHTTGRVAADDGAIVQRHAKATVREDFFNKTVYFDKFFFCH